MRALIGSVLGMLRLAHDARLLTCHTHTSSQAVGVVVTPWFGSSVPWFSIVIGLLLASHGHHVIFIIDDFPIGLRNNFWRMQLTAIHVVMWAVGRRCQVITLSSYAKSSSGSHFSDLDYTEKLASLNAVWFSRGESQVTKSLVDNIRLQLLTANNAIRFFLSHNSLNILLVPNGVIGTSGLWLRHGRSCGVRVSTYDSGGSGKLLLAVDGVAAQLEDIPLSFYLLKDDMLSQAARDLVTISAINEINDRKIGKDDFKYQVEEFKDFNPAFPSSVLIALNSSWDSAALGLHTVFGSTQEWLVETVRYLLDQTSVSVLVRQHPSERLPIAQTSDDYQSVLSCHFGNEPRLHFIAANDPVNSYQLINHVCAVVVYTSTIGIEAVIQNKVVVTESRSYYADLGFVHKATTRDDYYQLLSNAVNGHLRIDSTMRDNAVNCYYITQCCNWIKTQFSIDDLSSWSHLTLNNIVNDPSIEMFVDAIEKNVPFSFLYHQYRNYSGCGKNA